MKTNALKAEQAAHDSASGGKSLPLPDQSAPPSKDPTVKAAVGEKESGDVK